MKPKSCSKIDFANDLRKTDRQHLFRDDGINAV